MNLADVRREFCEKVVHGFDLLRTETSCQVGESMFVYRTRGEVDYLESLDPIPAERLESWHGTS